MAKVVEPENVKKDLISLFHNLAVDDQVSNTCSLFTNNCRVLLLPFDIKVKISHFNIFLKLCFVQDSVRLLAVEACASISSLLSKEEVESFIVPTLSSAAKVSLLIL